MSLVADASILIEAIGGSSHSPTAQWARALLANQSEVVTCDVADVECVSAWRRQSLRGEISAAELAELVGALRQAPLTRVPSWPLTSRMLELSNNLTPCDAAYVAIAEALRMPLATLDAAIATVPGIGCEVLTPAVAG